MIIPTCIRARLYLLKINPNASYFEKLLTEQDIPLLATPEGLDKLIQDKGCTVSLPGKYSVTISPLTPSVFSTWSKYQDNLNILEMSGEIDHLNIDYITALRSAGWTLIQASVSEK